VSPVEQACVDEQEDDREQEQLLADLDGTDMPEPDEERVER